MKYPINSREYDASRNIFIIKRQRGFSQFIERINKFKSLPRWDLNKLADLEIINTTNNSAGSDFQTFLRKQKEVGWKELKPRNPHKMKLKIPDPSGIEKFRLKPHDPDVLTRVSLPQKIDECLQNEIEWLYNAGLGQVIIKIVGALDHQILDPLMMHIF